MTDPAARGCRNRVIVVLGARLRPDGSPTPLLIRRAEAAATAYHAGAGTWLILTGTGFNGQRSEAAAMAELLCCRGVPEPALRLEEQARTTAENGWYVRQMLQQNEELGTAARETPLLLVTDRAHARRARLVFACLGMATELVPVQAAPGGWQAALYYLREACALPLALLRLAVLIRRAQQAKNPSKDAGK